MTILRAYSNYPISSTLREHMIRSAAVGKIVSENINDLNINIERIIQVLLLHDTGNLIKFDFNKFSYLLGKDIDRLEYWINMQKKIIQKYGPDEHKATELIAREIGVMADIQNLLEKLLYSSTKNISESLDWETKICAYADLRCGPNGILSINERFDELIIRYKHRNHIISNIQQTEENRKFALIIEQQLQEHTAIDLQNISDAVINPLFPALRKTQISTSHRFAQ